MERAFDLFQIPRLPEKPRKTAMLIASDNGLVYALQKAYLEEMHDLIDVVKFGDNQGLVTRWSEKYFLRKTALYREYGIPCYPGGASFEIAYQQQRVTPYFKRVKEVGFSAVEISEDCLPPIPQKERLGFIKEAVALGLGVYTEVGRKMPDKPMDVPEAIDAIKSDLAAGSTQVVVEGDEVKLMMKGVGKPQDLVRIVEAVGKENVIFECGPGPYPETPIFLIKNLGPEVNLMNIDLTNCNWIRTYRLGMRREEGWTFITKRRWETG